MAEHHELVAEMPVLEQMGTQERQKLAKKRRLQQLKKWGQREKEWIAKEKQLNKRLANMLHEENNGLNLKHYSTYSSNHRSKKKLQSVGGANNNNNNNNNNNINTTNNNGSTQNGKNTYHNNNSGKSNTFLSNNLSSKPDPGLAPNGRVHFNIGVMLLEAAARNDFDEVKRFLMLGVSPDSVNHDGLTALHQCCIDASEPIMNLLLEFGANVDAKDTEQWTPLHAACTCGHLNLVRILVENNANLLAVNGDGNMPFDICEDEATLDYIETQMVKRGITQDMIDFTRASTEMQMISDLEKQVAEGQDLNMANESGVTQLHIAAANGYLSVVKFLLKHGVNVNVCDNDLWRPLHGAACWGTEQHAKVIELLVEAGAYLNAKTINDETVFDLCDNAELSEKLNQLKDELESKQASGTDKLRWTQSRTNSRVHSVRRTSVRDKNQISRREAREEALLRVDSSTTTAATTTTTTNESSQVPNGVQSSVAGSEFDNLKVVDTTSKTVHPKVPTNEPSINLSTSPSKSTASTSDQVNSVTKNKVNPSLSSRQTDLDDCKPNESDKTIAKEDALNGSPRSSDSESTANSLRQRRSVEHDAKANQLEITNNVHQIIPTKTKASTDDSKLVQGNISISTTSSQVTRTMINDDSGSNSSTALTKAMVMTERVSNSASHLSNTDTACDSSQQKQQAIVQSTIVHLTPINYTLSNLKKQRSDLRMRTTSIGGNSTINSNGTTVTIPNEANNQVLLDPQPSSLSGCDSLNRPESPSSTFRKFRGEPSEVIGLRERNIRHKCCILI